LFFGRRTFYVYMMMSSSRRALYTGVTGNLMTRVRQHKNHVIEGFCDKYNCTRLVYFEPFFYVKNAIGREKQIKGWRREKKIGLIEAMNPEYRDLASHWK
jgi:putative endonuclease